MFKFVQSCLHSLRGQNIVDVDGVKYKGGRFEAQQVRDLILPRDVFAELTALRQHKSDMLYIDTQEGLVSEQGTDRVDVRFVAHTGQFRIAYRQATVQETRDEVYPPFLSLRGHLQGDFAYLVARRHGRSGQESITAPANSNDIATMKHMVERVRKQPEFAA